MREKEQKAKAWLEQLRPGLDEVVDGVPGQDAFPVYTGGRYFPVYTSGNYFESWFENWMKIIEPCMDRIQQKIGRGDNRPVVDLLFAAQKMGFYLGVLVGCKSMCASREDLITKGQAWVIDPVLWLIRYAESTNRRKNGKEEVSRG